MSSGQTEGSIEFKERLIASVKKEVKQVMEEAVTKKCVHEESGSVTSLCAAVEACLSQGLRRRALGLFKTSSTTALLHKVAKHCSEAQFISRKVQEIEHNDPNKRSSSSSDSTSKPPILKKNSSTSITNISPPSPVVKYLWIRLALYEKKLSRIIEHLVTNATRYYDKESLVADPDYGSILGSLLVGPCALDYSRARTSDHFWTDPPADELVQRHRISSGHPTPPPCRRPIMNFKRSLHTSSEDGSTSSFKSTSSITAAKNYVESLHQNSRAALLYGKNNVLVLPKDVNESMPGYLSLHQTVSSLTIKWTPNQLMNGYNETEVADKTSYWKYSLNINVDEIVYVHCHQQSIEESGGTIILVGQDGVQRPPIHFPEGGHMAQFLSCLETGLLPHGQLDPPLWSQKGMGKTFPWISKGNRRPLPSVMENTENVPIDYVFRVVNKTNHEEFREFLSKFPINHIRNKLASVASPVLDIGRASPRRAHLSSSSTNESSDSSNKSLSLDVNGTEAPQQMPPAEAASIALVCTTMRRQIISRAFYGWFAYCRHLKTVRTHLSGLVNSRIIPDAGAEGGLTKEQWASLHVDGVVADDAEVYRLVYFGGVQPELRKEVWPYLLGHYSFGTTADERAQLDETTRHYYETTMSEWLAVEAIVRQRDKEKTAHAVAKLSSESSEHRIKLALDQDGEIENDVFEENGFSDLSDPEYDEPLDKSPPCEKPNRLNKSSTDSGNVPDEETAEDKLAKGIAKSEGKKDKSNSESASISSAQTPPPPPPPPADLKIPDTNCTENTEKTNNSNKSSPSESSYETVANDLVELIQRTGEDFEDVVEFESPSAKHHAVIITNASVDLANLPIESVQGGSGEAGASGDGSLSPLQEETVVPISLDALQEPKSACVSPASSNGGVYTGELLEQFGLNLHRIEKDVQRCDRNYWYFANENLDKLRNVICTYVWEHLEVGYMQGMCDLVAPLLVIFDDESLSYGCFCRLMERMIENFPSGNAMDMHFANMRSLIQILDSEMYDLMHAHNDYTHFYFCYRWFLLDFKRELVYTDIFATWEIIWAAKHVASSNFVLFLALALLETYREIILSNNMDFTDVIKFFNEMAERHNVAAVLNLARSLVHQVQTLIENK